MTIDIAPPPIGNRRKKRPGEFLQRDRFRFEIRGLRSDFLNVAGSFGIIGASRRLDQPAPAITLAVTFSCVAEILSPLIGSTGSKFERAAEMGTFMCKLRHEMRKAKMRINAASGNEALIFKNTIHNNIGRMCCNRANLRFGDFSVHAVSPDICLSGQFMADRGFICLNAARVAQAEKTALAGENVSRFARVSDIALHHTIVPITETPLEERNFMTIEIGDKLPETTLTELGKDGPAPVQVSELTRGRRIALFAVPGAYTPTCHNKHVPSFVTAAKALSEKGVDEIVCLSVNDPFVMNAWGEATGAIAAGIRMLADTESAFTKAVGLEFSAPPAGLFSRSQRYSMLVEDGVVKVLNVEGSPGEAVCSLGEALVDQI